MDREGVPRRQGAVLIVMLVLLVSAGYLGIQRVIDMHLRRTSFIAMERAQRIAIARTDADRNGELSMARVQYQRILLEVQEVMAEIDSHRGGS
jgi:hypothetical protein